MTPQAGSDAYFMGLALEQARQAGEEGEVPVGAVVVQAGRVIGAGRNAPIGTHDPTAHAEVMALRQAALTLGNYRLDDCTLYVTLEPCAMCAGASMHARVERIVYGATDPKAGAAGSVVDLFQDSRLNHHTEVHAGVRHDECSHLLHTFFEGRREHHKQLRIPLREDALRTPDSRFELLPDDPWAPNYLSDLESLSGLRLHYLDEGPRDADATWLCLHGSASWSFVYRHLMAGLLAAGQRVVVPDLIGFGRSDKLKKESSHRFDWHRRVVQELIDRLELKRVTLVVEEGDGLLGLILPLHAPDRIQSVQLMDTSRSRLEDDDAFHSPYPDAGHRAAQRIFPQLLQALAQTQGETLVQRLKPFMHSMDSPRIPEEALRSLQPLSEELALQMLSRCAGDIPRSF